MKQQFFLFLLLALLLPAPATAQVEIDGIYYGIMTVYYADGSIVDGAAVCSGGNPYSGDVIIPDSIIYNGELWPVKWIDYNAFEGCNELTSINIPNSVIEIRSYAFYGCSGLTSVTIGNSVTSIGDHAFYGCSGLTSVTIGNSVTSIGYQAFYGCSGLTSITIPNAVTYIGEAAFQGCTALDTLNFNAISCNEFNLASYQPFYNLNISNINIGDSVQRIPAYFAYRNTNLTSITIPNAVTYIGNSAFSGCNGITDLIWNPRNCSSNGNMTTSNIERVTIGNEVEVLPSFFVSGSKITSVDIPNSVTYIGDRAFYGCCGLTSITIPNAVTSIGNWAFSDCSSLTSVTIGNSVTSIGSSVFYNCSSLSSVTIPSSITTIGNDAFDNCSGLTRVNISDIEAWCKISFSNGYANPLCYGHRLYLNGEEVTDLVIPNSVTFIGNYAFYYCSGLTSVIIPNSITSIGNSAFCGCSGLIRANIPDSVTSIGNDAFVGCSRLNSISIPNSVTYIGESAFASCSGLTSILIPNSVNFIGQGAFAYCSGLTNAIISNSVASLEAYIFRDCISLTNITIPNSVTSIGDYAFYHCSSLTNINIPNSVTSIGYVAFRECSALTSVTIGSSVTFIDDYAFYYCNQIHTILLNAVNCTRLGGFSGYNYHPTVRSLQFGDSVEHIPTGLPSFYMSNKTLIIPNGVKSIAAGAIDGSCASVVIGKGLENIAAGTFPWDVSVAYATTAEPLPCEPGAFANPQTLYVPAGSKMKYFTAPGWSEFANIIEGEYTQATAIELDQDNATLYRDATLQLSATVLPDTASATSIGWYSLNPNVASVDNNGSVYANGVGETDIIVWVDQVADTCHVKVTPIMVENITLSANHLSLALEETYTLTANASPNNAENRTLEWIIPDNDVLLTQQVTPTSLNIGAAGEGTVTITVRATDGSGRSATCEVFVSANTPVKNLTLTPTAMNLYVGNSQQINAIITPQDAYTQDLRWMSSNTNVATVNSSGLVTAHGVGSAVITAMTTDGSNLSATCAVTVTNILVESVMLNANELEMNEGESAYLSATVLPYNAYDRSLTWTSSNPRVASVTNNGRVTALEVGSTIITATSNDGTNISASCHVTVKSQTGVNCFVMPDTAVLHGEAITIPVRMTNNQSFMAFQTDIYLPAGFNLSTNQDDEFVITLSERLSNDHAILANRMSDGAIRVICYTPNSQPIDGYQGDLFFFTVKVPEDAVGDYAINLRNSLLTNTDYQELSIPDAGAVLMVSTYMPGDANDSHSVTVTDIVVTAQYVLQMNPDPFIFEAADMNGDGYISVTDIMLIAYLINHPTMNVPKRMPDLTECNDRMSGENVNLTAGETRTFSISLDNDMLYSAFQLDLTLPEGLMASNFQLTDRASNHALDVSTVNGDKLRALCYSPAIEAISGHGGALLTFDVSATGYVVGDITVDSIELVTADCRTVLLDAFTIGVNNLTGVNEVVSGKVVDHIEYYNLAGQRIDRPESGVTLVVTTYTDGTSNIAKVIK